MAHPPPRGMTRDALAVLRELTVLQELRLLGQTLRPIFSPLPTDISILPSPSSPCYAMVSQIYATYATGKQHMTVSAQNLVPNSCAPNPVKALSQSPTLGMGHHFSYASARTMRQIRHKIATGISVADTKDLPSQLRSGHTCRLIAATKTHTAETLVSHWAPVLSHQNQSEGDYRG